MLSPDLGHAVSSLIAITYILIVAYLFVNHIKTDVNRIELLIVGIFWSILTIVFEFGFGHYVMGHSWGYLLADYNILKGRLRSFVLLTMLIAPPLWGHILEVKSN